MIQTVWLPTNFWNAYTLLISSLNQASKLTEQTSQLLQSSLQHPLQEHPPFLYNREDPPLLYHKTEGAILQIRIGDFTTVKEYLRDSLTYYDYSQIVLDKPWLSNQHMQQPKPNYYKQ
jgi:hypothetical protein